MKSLPCGNQATLTFMLPGWGVRPSISDSLHLLPQCLLKTSEYNGRNPIYSYLFFPSPGFTAGSSGNWWNLSTAFVCYFTIPFISFIRGLSWISLSHCSTNVANTSPVLDSFQGYRWLSRVTWARRPLCHFHPASRERTAAAFVISPSLCCSVSDGNPGLGAWSLHTFTLCQTYLSQTVGKSIQELMELKEDRQEK